MLDKIIIADTSVLIALDKLELLDLCEGITQEFVVTKTVYQEYGKILPSFIKELNDPINFLSITEIKLDKGELSAIGLALEEDNSILAIDERKGRRIATSLGIRIIGTLRILKLLKEIGVIALVHPYIHKLNDIGFRMSEKLIEIILNELKENP